MEILDQIEFVNIAIKDINKELQNPATKNDRFWYSIQSFLVSVANISKILYPSPSSKEINKIRAKRLRENIGLPENSILTTKAVRNCFEHYDEKLDDFQNNNNGIYLGKAICDFGDIVVDNKTTGFYIRHYNPKTNILYFKGIKYNLQDVVNEIVVLKEKVEKVKNSS
jgi:hypothetical protein